MSYARPTTWAAVLFAVAIIGSANADHNLRPIAVTGTGLQDSLDAITVAGPGYDAADDQAPFGRFTGGASGGAVVTLMWENSPMSNTNQFGMYDASSLTKVPVFGGSHTTGAQSLISFRADGSICVNFVELAPAGAFRTPNSFGFYLDVYEAPIGAGGDGDAGTLDYSLYSEDALNRNSKAQAIVYQGDDETRLQVGPFAAGTFTSNEFIIAFEDVLLSSTKGGGNYASLAVIVESITPLPAPTALLLGGMGLSLVGCVRRRLA